MCGYIKGFQYRNPNTFNSSIFGNVSLKSWYIDGVSLTHGSPGATNHVWSFVNAWYDVDVPTEHLNYTCPCTVEISSTWAVLYQSLLGITTSAMLEVVT